MQEKERSGKFQVAVPQSWLQACKPQDHSFRCFTDALLFLFNVPLNLSLGSHFHQCLPPHSPRGEVSWHCLSIFLPYQGYIFISSFLYLFTEQKVGRKTKWKPDRRYSKGVLRLSFFFPVNIYLEAVVP